jgi:hypothetical protein
MTEWRIAPGASELSHTNQVLRHSEDSVLQRRAEGDLIAVRRSPQAVYR